MHDTGESGRHFGQWGKVEHGIIFEWESAIRNILIGKMTECFSVYVMGAVGDFENASFEGSVHLVVVYLIFDVCPVIFFASGERNQQK